MQLHEILLPQTFPDVNLFGGFAIVCFKVVEGSTAEKCGLLEGDVVVRINDKPTINMTHEDAHRELVAAGTEFVLGVLRLVQIYFQLCCAFQGDNNLLHNRATSISHQEETEDEIPAEVTVGQTEFDLQQEQERIDKIIPDASVTDEEIADLLSGEAEVLKGHGVLGYVYISSKELI